jgi:predicted ArsR family transcriptional regulator
MHKTKQEIINLLKMNGGLTTRELSEYLDISTTAVRRHLYALEDQDLVRFNPEQRGMGRPSFVYELTDNIPTVFKQSFAAFVNAVMEEIGALDNGHTPRELFDERQEGRNRKYVDLTTGETLTDRVACLARLMESEGRITTWQQVDENCYILREHNCPFHRLNGNFDLPCRREVSLLQKTLHADVQRVNHIMKGDVACVYRIECQRNGKRWHSGKDDGSSEGEHARAYAPRGAVPQPAAD